MNEKLRLLFLGRWTGGLMLVSGLALAVTGCQSGAPGWRSQLTQELPLLGHRNWIVIADSAYPAQSGRGIETLYTGSSQLEVVRTVLARVDQAAHVRPVVYLDAELGRIPGGMVPGIEAYREELNGLLQGRRVETLPHEELIAKLDQAGEVFRILILKTDLTMPYTSVFLELDCGYWSGDLEKELRQSMREAE